MSHFKTILYMFGLRRVGLMAAPLLAVAVLVASGHPVIAQDDGDAAAGHQIAAKWCSSCHVVGREQHQATSNGAPTFTAIANMKSTT